MNNCFHLKKKCFPLSFGFSSFAVKSFVGITILQQSMSFNYHFYEF